MAAPMEMPPTTKRPIPSASAAASTSSANIAIENGRASPGSDWPWARHSRVRRASPAGPAGSPQPGPRRRPGRAGTRSPAPAPPRRRAGRPRPAGGRVTSSASPARRRGDARRLLGGQSVGHQRAVEAHRPQAGDEMAEIDDPGARRVANLPVRVAVLRVGHADPVGEQVHRLGHDGADLGRRRVLEQVGRVEDELQPAASRWPPIRRRASAAEVTTLACSGSMPRSTPAASAKATACSISAQQVGPGVRAALSGWCRHWSSGSRVPVQSVTSGMPTPRRRVQHHAAAGRARRRARAGSGWIML